MIYLTVFVRSRLYVLSCHPNAFMTDEYLPTIAADEYLPTIVADDIGQQ